MLAIGATYLAAINTHGIVRNIVTCAAGRANKQHKKTKQQHLVTCNPAGGKCCGRRILGLGHPRTYSACRNASCYAYVVLHGDYCVKEEYMISRSIAFLLLIWMLGFAWFALLLPQPAPIAPSDGVVVLTGGAHRIDRGLEILESGKSKKLLISGVDRDVKPPEFEAQYPKSAKYFRCCIALGFQSVDTRSNALETAAWTKRNHIRSIRLVTHDWHMRRARFELDRALPDGIAVTNDAVSTQPSLGVLFKEYHKYALRAAASLLGL